jgi:tetratricopeptide (TPR) repeat protein
VPSRKNARRAEAPAEGPPEAAIPPEPAPEPTDLAGLLAAGRLAEAAALCQRALQHKPRDPEALHIIGNIRYREGRFDEAAFLLTALLGIAPDHVGGLNDLACVALEQRRPDEALALLDRLLALQPDHADALFNRGNALMALARIDEAAAAFEACRAVRPDDSRVLNNLASVRRVQGRHDEALALITEALAREPERPGLQANLGTILQSLGRHEPARAAFRRALEHDPSNAEVWNNLGTSLFEAGQPEAALQCLHQALAARPDFDLALFNLGNALVLLSRPEEGVAAYRRALAVRPDYAEAAHNLAGALMMCRRPDEALPVFRRALDLVTQAPDGGAGRRADGDRDDDRIRFSTSLALLTLGDYPAGFAAYESRLALSAVAPLQARHTIRPRWDGSAAALPGRTVVVYAEQGFGDNVQFCRYVPLLAYHGARVVIEAPLPLLPLLRTLPGVAEFIPTGEALPEFDLYCPMASLPLAFGTTIDRVPNAVPYLHEAAERVARWQPEVSWDGRRRVGIAWSGNPAFTNDRWRTMALRTLAPLRACGVALHVLQRDVRPEDRAVLDGWDDVRDLSGAIVDFADTAALASLMDLVISVDTSVAHVAGATGVPVWVLLPYAADWRWLRDGDRSLWYPTARLHRQTAPADWDGVVARIAALLAD